MKNPNFRTKVGITAAALIAVFGGSACAGDESDVKTCPENYKTVSIEVDGAAPVIQAFAQLSRETAGGWGEDTYDMVNDTNDRYESDTPDRVDTARDVVCVAGDSMYLSEEALRIVGMAQADGYEFDFEAGTAEIPTEEE